MPELALSFRGGKTCAARILNSLGVPPALPYLGISRAMINRVDYDFVVFHLEHYLVGKSANQRSSHLLMYDRILFRIFLNRCDALVNLAQEIIAKFAVSFVVPLDGLLGVEISFWRESRLHFFLLRRRSRTSGQGFAAEGSLRCSRLRRSNSLRWADVKGIDAGSAAMLSQISSINSRRFLTLKLRMSSIRILMPSFCVHMPCLSKLCAP